MFTLYIVLFCIHSGFYNVNNVVAKFLTFLNQVHVHRSYSIGIGVRVHVIDVLGSQLIAEVIDFILASTTLTT